MNELSDVLKARLVTHGDFTDNAKCDQRLKEDMRAWTINWQAMEPYQRTALDMIVHKIARILTGNPDEPDHWVDIAGYATLVVDRLRK